ncbi:hypothetical protein NDU88_005245 [Pleurodeles waltl]|uniref:Uncharacterized protein n=1 Tax=Pleurodeles waltl TaxID=8319 RepID=A0AAV7VL40_PLEWA|nr:hypothetical protein NDU88_005245 [Pleurodeles waltl]
MPRGKTTGKATDKPARQLLFSEALRQQKHPSAEDHPPLPCTNMADDTQGATMDQILQEMSTVSRKLEGMDNAMVALTAETRSMLLDIAGFQSQISRLDQRPARMWITKNGESQNFYNPEDLRAFLEGFQDQTQSMETTAQTPRTQGVYPRELATRHPHRNLKCVLP